MADPEDLKDINKHRTQLLATRPTGGTGQSMSLITYYLLPIKVMQYRKTITYNEFMDLPVEVRREHTEFFLSSYPDYCPVVVSVYSGRQSIALRMCKFLLRKNRTLCQQQQLMRNFIIKHSHGVITPNDTIIFFHDFKMIDQHLLVGQFQARLQDKINQEDGWVHLKVSKQWTFG